MKTHKVHVYKTSPKQLIDDVERAMVDAGMFLKFDSSQETLIKINGNCDKYYPGSNTSPWFLDVLLKILKKRKFNNIFVIEGDLFEFKVEEMLERTHIGEVLNKNNVDYINYEKLPRYKNKLPKLLKGKQIINVPVIHTHGFAKISVATKNFWGFYPVNRRHMHKELNERLLKLHKQVPVFTLVDGTVGMVGDSTRTGIPRLLDMIMSGWNTLAVDRVAAKLMGFKEDEIPLLIAAEMKRMLPQVQVTGDYTNKSLPSENFQYEDTFERKVTRWLEGLDNPNLMNSITSAILHAPVIDWLYNNVRMAYNNRQYKNKKHKIFDGSWMEYENLTPYINYKDSH